MVLGVLARESLKPPCAGVQDPCNVAVAAGCAQGPEAVADLIADRDDVYGEVVGSEGVAYF